MSEDRPPPEPEAPSEELPPAEAPIPPTPAEPIARQPVPLSRLILGLVLVAVGVIWLLEALDVVSFSFLAVLPGALIVVGVVLIGAARTGRHSPLIVLGIVLTVILTIASSFDIRLRGGVGDRMERPTTLTDIQREYHLSVGQLTIDLREVDFGGGTTLLKASIGIGQLTVRVPDGAGLLVEADGHVGAGDIRLFDRESSGLDVNLTARQVGQGPVPAGGNATLILDLSVGLGQIEVTR